MRISDWSASGCSSDLATAYSPLRARSFLRPARTGFRMARQRSCRCLHLQGHCRNSAHQLTEISLSAKPHNRTSYRRIGIDVRFAAFYRHRHDGRKGEAKRSHTITKRSEEHTSELQ